jgi:hypothetical protein
VRDGTGASAPGPSKTINCLVASGPTAYANAIDAAQAELDKNGRANVGHYIVFFTDGAANTGPAYYAKSSPYRQQPCHQGVNSAAAAKSKGTIVYSIGYTLRADHRAAPDPGLHAIAHPAKLAQTCQAAWKVARDRVAILTAA